MAGRYNVCTFEIVDAILHIVHIHLEYREFRSRLLGLWFTSHGKYPRQQLYGPRLNVLLRNHDTCEHVDIREDLRHKQGRNNLYLTIILLL